MNRHWHPLLTNQTKGTCASLYQQSHTEDWNVITTCSSLTDTPIKIPWFTADTECGSTSKGEDSFKQTNKKKKAPTGVPFYANFEFRSNSCINYKIQLKMIPCFDRWCYTGSVLGVRPTPLPLFFVEQSQNCPKATATWKPGYHTSPVTHMKKKKPMA